MIPGMKVGMRMKTVEREKKLKRSGRREKSMDEK